MKAEEQPHNTFLTLAEEQAKLKESKLRELGLHSEGYTFTYSEDEAKAIEYINTDKELPKALIHRLLDSKSDRWQQHMKEWQEMMSQPPKEGEYFF